ncbi:chloride channel protein [Ruegeria sp. PrR005]|uniref:Chloride channel protein n=1 Tax=Ruegeria sp. PrR005 TaxID=2706882 RepID=A0A6B2NR24_9RHOB|nr:chloride channel protein [Ruegeria sp. PrR005]NDW44784.1 chloride channel protein [Ruegeria sp. PrR005]
MRITVIAVLVSLLAGAFAALVLKGMIWITDFVWHRDIASSPLYILAACVAGGVLVGLTRRGSNHVQTLEEQIAAASDPMKEQQRTILMTALGAIFAVGFGGALGPEAGLIAAITEISVLVSMILARSADEARTIGQASISAALAGLYASPPGGYAYTVEDEGKTGWQRALDASFPYLGFVAAVAGFVGFKLAGHVLFEEGFHRLHLPHYASPGDGSDLLGAFLPAVFGALVGAVFLYARAFVSTQVERRITSPVLQSALGGLLFGAVAALFPFVRFSGHHEFDAMVAMGAETTAMALIGIALLKVLAMVLCLSTGWRGGAIFPLIFAGGAAGYAAHLLQGGGEVAVALAAGLAAATTVGMGKPVAALLIVVFLVGTQTWPAVCIGVAVGLIAARFSPKPSH